MGDFVLDGENVGQVAIEALRPDVGAVAAGDQLGRDAYAWTGFAHAAFEQELDAEFLADVLHLHRATLVGERGVARDDGEARDLREISDDVLGDAVAEILLLRVAAHIGEWQDRDRRFVAFR